MKQINVILRGKKYKNKGVYYPENNSLKLLKGAFVRKVCGSTYKFEAIRQDRIREYCHEEEDFFLYWIRMLSLKLLLLLQNFVQETKSMVLLHGEQKMV